MCRVRRHAIIRRIANGLPTEGPFGAGNGLLAPRGGSANGRRHCLTIFPLQKFGRSISSSAPRPGRTPSRYAWLHGNCAAVASSVYGETSLVPHPRTRPAPMCCSSPTTPAQKSVVILLSAGRCPSAYWTCSPSFAITPTVFPRSAARACSALLPTTAWTASAPSRKTKCATWSCAADHGRPPSGRQSSIIAKVTWRRWRDCCRPCCPASTSPVHCCGVVTWLLRRGLSTMVYQ